MMNLAAELCVACGKMRDPDDIADWMVHELDGTIMCLSCAVKVLGPDHVLCGECFRAASHDQPFLHLPPSRTDIAGMVFGRMCHDPGFVDEAATAHEDGLVADLPIDRTAVQHGIADLEAAGFVQPADDEELFDEGDTP
nr:hypothetical protein OH837_12735 [Streptomyces canus]